MSVSIITSRTREVYTRRPLGPLVINWASRQMIGLVAWYPSIGGSGPNTWANVINSQFSMSNSNGSTIATNQEMGRVVKLDDASNQQFVTATGASSIPLSAYPFTLAAWFNSDDITVSQSICGLRATTGGAWHRIAAFGTVAGDPLRAQSNTTSAGNADTTIGYTANQWYHATGVFLSDTSRSAYLNAKGKATNATSNTFGSMDQFKIGALDLTGQSFSGMIADVRAYNWALSDNDIYALYDPDTRWELYYPIGRISYFFATAGAATTTLSAAKAAMTFSGNTSVFKVTDLAAKGAMTIAAKTGGFTVIQGATKASMTFSGSAALFKAALTAEKANLSLAGKTATFSQVILFLAQKGLLSFTGKPSSFTETMLAVKSVLALTAKDATFRQTIRLLADKGLLTFDERDVSFAETLDAFKAALSMLGKDATFPAAVEAPKYWPTTRGATWR